MGLYPIDCPACGKPHIWFSGTLDQRCDSCRRPTELKAIESELTLLVNMNTVTGDDDTVESTKDENHKQAKKVLEMVKSYVPPIKRI